MALIRLSLLIPLIAIAGFGQQTADVQFKEAGVCARCHVISVVEWGMSKHRRAGTGCETCHGASQGHVIDERNNVKPERVPHDAAISGLCADRHKSGCPKSGHKAGCQTCHHFHALVDPRKPAVAQVDADRKPEAAKAKPSKRFSNPALPGFEIAAAGVEPATGLAQSVRVAGLGIDMLLVPGGESDIGSERFPKARPIHTVRVESFYLGRTEVTQAQWKSLMGANPSARQGAKFPDADRMPVEQVSWDDAQAFLGKLNERIPGGGFRLPTEAEWEYAARAADRLGLLNMLRDVWEWCSSLDRPYPYNAADGREETSGTAMRILRGGNMDEPAVWVDAGMRHAERPMRRLRSNGLRVARAIR